MKILVYGAGNMGCLYAAKLQQGGEDVALLARGPRLDRLRASGIVLEDTATGERTETRVDVVENLAPTDAFDLVVVALPKHRVAEVLPVLARNQRVSSFLFMCNNAEGPSKWIDALGEDRVLLGFPGAAAVDDGAVIRYLVTSKSEQATTVGEVDGKRSERIVRIRDAFQGAGFPSEICSNMDAWLKTHVARIIPTANALYMAGGDLSTLAQREILRLLVRAIGEGFAVLQSLGVPLTPSNHRVFTWLPESLLLVIMRRMVASEQFAIKTGHALEARAEMGLLADEFRTLAMQTDVPTPAIDALSAHINDGAAAVPA